MNISSGWCKGLKLNTPEGLATRPTRSRVREAVTNMIQTSIDSARVLDLFAGSGAVGIELLSRGAAEVSFVEVSKEAKRVLDENLSNVKKRALSQKRSAPMLEVYYENILETKPRFSLRKFDIIWADPPYEIVDEFMDKAKDWLPTCLDKDGIFIIESGVASSAKIEEVFGAMNLEIWKQRAYGVTLISIGRLS